jgi:archaetidylinositol phosphate synthase
MAGEIRETRIHGSFLAAAEKRLLIRIASRLPQWVTSDQLTSVGALAMVAAGVCYGAAPAWNGALFLAVLLLGVNWFGDSLDGTLARVRHQERPRYGFYVDHMLDVVGVACLIGGLVAGGYMSVAPAAAFLIAYYLLMIEIALATHTLGTFRMSFWMFGPTELRILLAIGTLQLLRSPLSTVAGHRMLLFDFGGAIGAAALVVIFVAAAVQHTRTLYGLEPLPGHASPRSTPVET